MKNVLKSFPIILLVFVLVTLFGFTDQHLRFWKDKPEGKFHTKVYLNNEVYKEMPETKFYVLGNYCLEENRTSLENTKWKLIPNGEPILKEKVIRDSVSSYLLSDLKKKICYQFEADKDNLKLVEIYPLKDKKLGFHFNEENLSFNGNPASFVKIKDTLINNINFKQLSANDVVKEGGESFNRVFTAYVNPDLKDFPFSFLSESLDKKFGGLTSMVEITGKNMQ